MAITEWKPIVEPDTGRHARKLGAKIAKSTDPASSEADFWNRNDLIYIGDMEWTHTGYEGYEYMADIKARESNGFYYKYGFVALTEKRQVAQTLVCEVRNHASDPLLFEMLIAGEWQPGPLRTWLDSLHPDVQGTASARYQSLVGWVRSIVQN